MSSFASEHSRATASSTAGTIVASSSSTIFSIYSSIISFASLAYALMFEVHVYATARYAFECAHGSSGCFESNSSAASTLARSELFARAAITFSASVRARVFVGQSVDETALLPACRHSPLACTIFDPTCVPQRCFASPAKCASSASSSRRRRAALSLAGSASCSSLAAVSASRRASFEGNEFVRQSCSVSCARVT